MESEFELRGRSGGDVLFDPPGDVMTAISDSVKNSEIRDM